MIENELIKKICNEIEQEKSVQHMLPGGGVLFMDKLMPYICVYRYNTQDPYFSGLLRTQASYLIIPDFLDISELLEQIALSISKKLNAFLILELWYNQNDVQSEFEILCPSEKAPATIAALKEGFNALADIYPGVSTKILNTPRRHPLQMENLLEREESKESGVLIIGLAIPVLYIEPENREIYSLFYRRFNARLSEIIKRAAFEFIRVQTSNPFKHYLMLGKTQLDKVTIDADKKLARISEGMSFLLRATPVNSTTEWEKFVENNFTKEPSFNYRLITLDPEKIKRKLYNIRLDHIEDPTLAFILRDKRLEIEKQLTMLEERGTDGFRYIGESIYGKIEDNVIAGARTILQKYPHGVAHEQMQRLDSLEFAGRAKIEMAYYQEKFPKMKLSLEIRKDVAGIMVSKTKLLISDQFNTDASRADALLHHEIGTHILIYCNGKNQPLQQMYAGFAGYDKLQEGLAVLAEYLVGGLTVNRMRTLACRVIAAESLVKGANFLETFNLLKNEHNVSENAAYYITMRIYRGGGLTKDAIYLAGLLQILEYIKEGGPLETLYTGKFNTNHIKLIEELLHRNVLRKPVLPRFLDDDGVQERLKILRNGITLTELLN